MTHCADGEDHKLTQENNVLNVQSRCSISDDPHLYSYGTSGFRFHQSVMFQIADLIGQGIGICILLANRDPMKQKHYGMIVTASHNPSTDNGIKLINDSGMMISSSAECLLEQIVNQKINVSEILHSLISTPHISDSRTLYFLIGNDTRDSGAKLKELIIQGIKSVFQMYNLHQNQNIGAIKNRIELKVLDLGLRTTPEMHVCVMRHNFHHGIMHNPMFRDQVPDYMSYYVTLIQSMIKTYEIDLSSVVVDCSNGVGTDCLNRIFSNELKNFGPRLIHSDILNSKKLNHDCGSEYVMNHYVEYHQALLANSNKSKPGTLHAAFDGDADRIIMYMYDEHKIDILSGDHLSYLIFRHVIDVLLKSVDSRAQNSEILESDKQSILVSDESERSYEETKKIVKHTIHIGVVHTGYSNGGFIEAIDNSIKKINEGFNNYLSSSNLHIDVHRVVTPIGVKNLIKAAKQFDIGIYFESNGHGSVIVNNDFEIQELKSLRRLFNDLAGDAVMNLIAIMYIICVTKTKLCDLLTMFIEKQSKTLKIKVHDKNIYKTSHDQTELMKPHEIALALTEMLNQEQFKGCRAFVRPSGTEDILRLYVENNQYNSADLDTLASMIKKILF